MPSTLGLLGGAEFLQSNRRGKNIAIFSQANLLNRGATGFRGCAPDGGFGGVPQIPLTPPSFEGKGVGGLG